MGNCFEQVIQVKRLGQQRGIRTLGAIDSGACGTHNCLPLAGDKHPDQSYSSCDIRQHDDDHEVDEHENDEAPGDEQDQPAVVR
jgi:hypothetical protein